MPRLEPLASPHPLDTIRQWPEGVPLAVRWSAAGHETARVLVGTPTQTRTARTHAELEELLARIQPPPAGTESAESTSGWFGWIAYESGSVFEPAVTDSAAEHDRSWPLAAFQRVESSREFRVQSAGASAPNGSPRHSVGPLDPARNRDLYLASVRRAIEYIRAGDVYQVNLAHRMTASFSGSPRSLFADLAERACPWHGGYFEADGYALASVSPELFLRADLCTGEAWTRPMKGTRAFDGSTYAAARDALDTSAKDRAELAMIVDLMRNDLGRLCELGSVRVEDPRRIERHNSGVLQSTATVAGRLRSGTTVRDLLRAAFPAGSVTGAPKIRAMQIINELEPVARGPYCGTMLWAGDDGIIEANVLIRTACISKRAGGDVLDYSVGAGIVADSDPESEWRETLDKAAIVTGP